MDYFVLEAKKEALKSELSTKYGAVLVHRGKIVSRGHNFGKRNNSLNRNCFLCS
jgi:deoxycytidylate deaminase